MKEPATTLAPKAVKTVFIFGAGKVGTALARALRKAGSHVTLRAARKGWPRKVVDADVVVFAVRDGEITRAAAEAAERRSIAARAVCVHVAGSLDSRALMPLEGHVAGIAQMHPMISFASMTVFPNLERGHVHVTGDPRAVSVARKLVRSLGMTPRTFSKFDPVGYHAAAGLVANGAAALAAVGTELLVRSGAPREEAPAMLGPLLRSVAENIERLGFPGALTGPVRRGDVAAVARHLATIESRVPSASRLFVALVRAQVPLARAIAEAPSAHFDALARWVEGTSKSRRPSSVRTKA